MKTLIIILSSVLLLTGCGTCTHHCVMGFGPGNSAFETIGSHYNTMDPCQHYGKPDGHVFPDFCFSNAGKRVYSVKDANNKTIYKIQ